MNKQLSLLSQFDSSTTSKPMRQSDMLKIFTSVLVSEVVSQTQEPILGILASHPESIAIAQSFNSPKLVRTLRLSSSRAELVTDQDIQLEQRGHEIFYQTQLLGKVQILYKSPLPGELQAKLAVESAIDRFLEYLLKKYQIVVLNESDRHVQVFIPGKRKLDFAELWDEFLQTVLSSSYGIAKYQIPGLLQTFVAMLNSVKLANRGFAPQDFPIISKDQVHILAAWYYAVIKQVGERQRIRKEQIENLQVQLKQEDLKDKERKAKLKELESKQDKQIEECEKYQAFRAFLDKQVNFYESLDNIRSQLRNEGLDKKQRKTLEKKEAKSLKNIYLSRKTLNQLLKVLEESNGDPYIFLDLDTRKNPERFEKVIPLVKYFTKDATEQINSTTGANFTKCFSEIYRLLSLETFDPLPSPLLTEIYLTHHARSPGDSGGEFCYSCGVELSQKNKGWEVARFIFERPSQRLQSSSSESRPKVCLSCFALSFASPLKVTDESIILRLSPTDESTSSSIKLKDYVRMLTNKEVHLSAGKYVVLASDRTNKGDLAAPKLGQVQYALAKVASIFPQEVLTNFKFLLVMQGSNIELPNRHLIFIQGLMEGYGQSIISSGKEINMSLGDAVRYVQQDLPYLADYSLVKVSSIANRLKLEKTRSLYWEEVKRFMDSNSMQSRRAKLYQDVAALTGLTCAFVQSLESTAKKSMSPDDAAREVSKIIEKVDDATAFCYYATLGDEKKLSVQARLYHNPDNDFIYSQTLDLLKELKITDREDKDDQGRPYLQLYADDVSKAYMHFANQKDYAQDKGWKELTYNLKLSLYTRFPELVRKLKSTSEK